VFVVMQVLDFAVDTVENSATSGKRFGCQPKDVYELCSLLSTGAIELYVTV
jgi:hypothetical protein